MTSINLTGIFSHLDRNRLKSEISDISNDSGLRDAISKAVSAGALEKCSESDLVCSMRCFTVPKRDGGRRLIYDARPINKVCELPPTFEMETLPVILQNCTSGSYGASIDLKSAFWQIEIDDESSKLFGIKTDTGECFRWRRLPFGFAWSPVIFSAFVAEVIDKCRGLYPHVEIFTYLDDILVVGPRWELKDVVRGIVNVLQQSKVTISYKKSELDPMEEIKYLGFFRKTGIPRNTDPGKKGKSSTTSFKSDRVTTIFEVHPIDPGETAPSIPGGSRYSKPYQIHPRVDIWKVSTPEAGFNQKSALANSSPDSLLDTGQRKVNSRDLKRYQTIIPWKGRKTGSNSRHRCDTPWMGGMHTLFRNRTSQSIQWKIQNPEQTNSGTRARRNTIWSADNGEQVNRKNGSPADGQQSRILDSTPWKQQRPDTKSNVGPLLVVDTCAGNPPTHRLDSIKDKLLCRPLVEGTWEHWGKYSGMVKDILEGLLAPNTVRQYSSVISNFRRVAGQADPTHEDTWLAWIERRLQEVSEHTVAQNITEAKAALALRGIDLHVDNPKLDRLLTRISSRLRKMGRRSRMAKKNTVKDPRRVITLDEIKNAWIVELYQHQKRNWHALLNHSHCVADILNLNILVAYLETFVANMIGLLLGLRISDIGPTFAEIDQKGTHITAVNWKLSDPKSKRTFDGSRKSLDSLRTRKLYLPFGDSCDDPASWIAAVMRTKKKNSGFILGDGDTSLSVQQVKNIVNRIKVEKNYDHRFRVAHASLARASGIPDHLIQQWADWDHKRTIDIYERKVTPYVSWGVAKNYTMCLGFNRSFGEESSK